ncbi:DnaJ sub A member 3, mitochondrial [Entophlyctis luteolus]|nr:DnaJ sub A member 3, mitochondrial [Entophlyctis luteolus]
MFRLRQLGIRTGARTTPAVVYESLLFSCTKRFASQAHPDASETFYDLLAVPQSASQQTIKSQFYALSMKLHPDKVKLRGDQDAIDAATQRFVKINEAYSVLSDEVKRKEYDRVLAINNDSNRKPGTQQSGFKTSARRYPAYTKIHPDDWILHRNSSYKPPNNFYNFDAHRQAHYPEQSYSAPRASRRVVNERAKNQPILLMAMLAVVAAAAAFVGTVSGSIAGQYCRYADSYMSCTIDSYPVVNPFDGSEFHLSDSECWTGAGSYDVLVAEEMQVSIEADSTYVITKVSLTCGNDDSVVYTTSDFVSSNQVTWKCDDASGYAVLYCDGSSSIEIKYLYYGGSSASGGLCYLHDETCPSAKTQVKATSTKTATTPLPTAHTSAPVVGKCVPNTIEQVCEIVDDPVVNPFSGANFYVTGSGTHSALASAELNVSFTMQNNVLKSVTVQCTGVAAVTVDAGALGIEVDFFSACGSAGWVHLLDMETYIDMKQIWYYGNAGTGGLCYGSTGTCTLVKTVSTTAATKTTTVATSKTTSTTSGAKTSTTAATSTKITTAAATSTKTTTAAASTTSSTVSAVKSTSTTAAATTTSTPKAAAVTVASSSTSTTSTAVRYTYVAPAATTATTTSKNLLNSDAAGIRATVFGVALAIILI